MNSVEALNTMLHRGVEVFWPLWWDAAIKSTLVLILSATAAHCLRRASAAQRHLVWLTTLAILPVVPLLAITVPPWIVLPWPSSVRLSGTITTNSHNEPASPSSQADASVEQVQSAGSNAAVRRDTGMTAETISPGGTWMTQYGLSAIWLTGCLVTLLPFLGGAISLCFLERRSVVVESGPLHQLLSELASRLRINRPVVLLISADRQMPMQWDTIWPRVLLPAAARHWPKDRLVAVLLHELVHARRHDHFSGCFARLIVSLFWFQPLAWWALKRLRLESELATDDATLALGCRPSDYAEQLLYVAAYARADLLHELTAVSVARRSCLEQRVRAILDQRRNRRPLSGWAALKTIVFAIVTASPLAIVGGQTTAIDRTITNHAIAEQSSVIAPPAATSDRSLIRLGHTDNSADGRRSIAGSGHAVRMARPAEARYLLAVELYASRYGYPEPPDEDFHLYILNDDQQLIAAVPFPYATIERGEMRWYTLRVPAIEVPDHFYIALSFNPHRTKGVYVGFDERANPSHSYVGRPTVGFQPVGDRIEWMIRAVLSPRPQLQDPFETAGQQN